jgi:hypothetical protein
VQYAPQKQSIEKQKIARDNINAMENGKANTDLNMDGFRVCNIDSLIFGRERPDLSIVPTSDGFSFTAFNNPARLSQIADGVNDNDAASVGQVKDMISQSGNGSGNDAAANEKYFNIDYDGLVALKDVYRGFGLAGANVPYCISDKGVGVEGSQISELPERLVIPQNVNGENVTGFQIGAFAYNHRIKEVVLPSAVKVLPNGLFRESLYLKRVENTEQIEEIGSYTFSRTSIEEIRFPNLLTHKSYAFRYCSLLRLVDIGQVTTIQSYEFEFCEDLSEVLGGENVTKIYQRAFFGTRRLKSLPFLSNVTLVHDEAFFGSRCNFEDVYDAMVANGCEFKNYATYRQYNSTNYWNNVEPTPCKVPLNSLFHQKDPRWADHYIGNCVDENGERCTFAKNGCAFITLAEIYSALENVHFNSPEEFVTILESKGLMDLDYRNKTGWIQIANGLGYTTEHIIEMSSDNLKKVYTALKQGALIYRSVGTGTNSPNGGHAVLCYGVNSDGELLLSDTSQRRSDLGVYENHKSASAIYTHGSEECDVVIVKKKEQ